MKKKHTANNWLYTYIAIAIRFSAGMVFFSWHGFEVMFRYTVSAMRKCVFFSFIGAHHNKFYIQRDVLSVVIYHKRRGQTDRTADIRLALKEIEVYWEKARVPIIDSSNSARKILSLHNLWRDLQKEGKTDKYDKKKDAFIDKLDDLFDFGSPDTS